MNWCSACNNILRMCSTWLENTVDSAEVKRLSKLGYKQVFELTPQNALLYFYRVHSEKASVIRVSLKELRSITNDFDEAVVIGEGRFGIVYEGRLEDKREVAVKRKRLNNESLKDQEIVRSIAVAAAAVKHPRLLPLLSVCFEGEERCLVYPLMRRGSLEDRLHIRKKVPMVWTKRLAIALQVAEGLAALHALGIVHHDLKSDNVLLDARDDAVLIDFGFSRCLNTPSTSWPFPPSRREEELIEGSLGYLDPAYLSSSVYDFPTEVYALGIVLFELLTGLPAIIENGTEEGLMLSTELERWSYAPDCTDEGWPRDTSFSVAELGESCLCSRLASRPSAAKVEERLRSILEANTNNSNAVGGEGGGGGDETSLHKEDRER